MTNEEIIKKWNAFLAEADEAKLSEQEVDEGLKDIAGSAWDYIKGKTKDVKGKFGYKPFGDEEDEKATEKPSVDKKPKADPKTKAPSATTKDTEPAVDVGDKTDPMFLHDYAQKVVLAKELGKRIDDLLKSKEDLNKIAAYFDEFTNRKTIKEFDTSRTLRDPEPVASDTDDKKSTSFSAEIDLQDLQDYKSAVLAGIERLSNLYDTAEKVESVFIKAFNDFVEKLHPKNYQFNVAAPEEPEPSSMEDSKQIFMDNFSEEERAALTRLRDFQRKKEMTQGHLEERYKPDLRPEKQLDLDPNLIGAFRMHMLSTAGNERAKSDAKHITTALNKVRNNNKLMQGLNWLWDQPSEDAPVDSTPKSEPQEPEAPTTTKTEPKLASPPRREPMSQKFRRRMGDASRIGKGRIAEEAETKLKESIRNAIKRALDEQKRS